MSQTPLLGTRATPAIPITGTSIGYDNSTSGSPSTSVQDELDRLETLIAATTGADIQEVDGTPSVVATQINVPNDSLDVVGTTATLNYAMDRGGTRNVLYTQSVSGAITLDLLAYNSFQLTLTGNITITFSNPPPSGVDAFWAFAFIQGGAGSFTVTWPASVKWRAANGTNTGSAPTLSTAVGAQDDFDLSTSDGGTTYGAMPAVQPTSFAAPSLTLSTTNAAGAATTAIRSDATVAVFDATAPTTQAIGDAAATGSAGVAARRDHRHGMPSAADIKAAAGPQHVHVDNVVFSGDGATTVFILPAAPVDAYSIGVYVAGSRSQDWTLSGGLLDVLTFGSAPASAANNIVVDIAAAA